jgi:signal transduction histidine kinase
MRFPIFAAPAHPTDERIRPLVWRLPLLAIVALGLIALERLDELMSREYAQQAATQAVQTDALLESFLQQRTALLASLRTLAAEEPNVSAVETRLGRAADELVAGTTDLQSIAFLDESGETWAVHRRRGLSAAADPATHVGVTARAVTLRRAERFRTAVASPSVRLADGSRGMVIYVPLVRREQLRGFIAGALAHRELFQDALAGQLQGGFAYRVTESDGTVIALSPEYPAAVGSLVTREVTLPGGRVWRLDVAVPPLQPFTPRLVTWIVGLAILALLAFVVWREEARAKRFAAYTRELEALSRNLLDANLRLEERNLEIGEANRAKSRFLANVSHELRTPLNAIVGYNSLAIEGMYGPLPPALSGAHGRIAAAAEHLLGLVDDVLDLSKIEVGRMDVELAPLNLASLVDGVVTVAAPSATAKGVRLDAIVARNLPPVVSDARHVRQILLNLVSNAVKFTGEGGVTVYARATESADAVEISVQDTGIGIAERDLERIFDEFEQVRPSGRGDSMERGTGLGLAIARKLARLLGGDVRVESTLGAGSRFTFTLPTGRADQPHEVAAAVAPEGQGLDRDDAKAPAESEQEAAAGAQHDAAPTAPAAPEAARAAHAPPDSIAPPTQATPTQATPTPSGEHAALAPPDGAGGLDAPWDRR